MAPKRSKLKLETSFIDSCPAGLATQYLNCGEIDKRAGVEIAISCVFAPLGAARKGAPLAEVEALTVRSRTQFETYLRLALERCQQADCVRSNLPVAKTVVEPPELVLGAAEVAEVEPAAGVEDDNLLLDDELL